MSIEQNVAAGKAGRVVMDLALDEAANHEGGSVLHFWLFLMCSVLKLVPEKYYPWSNLPTGVVPMTSEEVGAFEVSLMPFGKHESDYIGSVPLEYLEWLDSQPDFRQQLRRYLAAKQVQRHMVVDDEGDV